MTARPPLVRLGWSLRDYAKRVWDNSGEDNIFFLAGGIAFNILLASIPFVLLLITGIAYLLDKAPAASSAEITALLDRFLPVSRDTDGPLQALIADVLRAGAQVTVWSAITFVWLSTRLFGSLRTVLAEVFDIETERGIIAGKLFDAKISVVATVLVAAYSALNVYLAAATTRGVAILADLGLREEQMGAVEETIGRVLAFAFILLMFFALYKYLPLRLVRWQTAFIAAMFTSIAFEIAKSVFTRYLTSFAPRGIYTGTILTIVLLVIWVYYAAMIFVLGGEVAQVYELRRVRRMQRETFEV
jgi:membrane protein